MVVLEQPEHRERLEHLECLECLEHEEVLHSDLQSDSSHSRVAMSACRCNLLLQA